MVIARERYLDDTRRFPLELALATKSGALHSTLSNMPRDEHDAIGSILVEALDRIEARLRPYVVSAPQPG